VVDSASGDATTLRDRFFQRESVAAISIPPPMRRRAINPMESVSIIISMIYDEM
jgi:hypothetical protein